MTCGSSGFLDVTGVLEYTPRIVGGVYGMFFDIRYSRKVSIPGSRTDATVRQRLTNLIGTADYRVLITDDDTDGDRVDDRARTLVTANTQREIPPREIHRIRFDCPRGTVITAADLVCSLDQLADSAGQLMAPDVAALVSCRLALTVP